MSNRILKDLAPEGYWVWDMPGDAVPPKHMKPHGSGKWIFLSRASSFLRRVQLSLGSDFGPPVKGKAIRKSAGGPAVPGDVSLNLSCGPKQVYVKVTYLDGFPGILVRVGEKFTAVDGQNQWLTAPGTTPNDVVGMVRRLCS